MTIQKIDKCIELRNEIKKCENMLEDIKTVLSRKSASVNFWHADHRDMSLYTQDIRLIRKMAFLAYREYKARLKKLKEELRKY